MNRQTAERMFAGRGINILHPIAPYLAWHEVVCSCGACGCAVIAPEQVSLWCALRDAAGVPITISSGYRCINHPLERVKKRPGMHVYGRALDMAWPALLERTRFASLVNGIWESGAVGLYSWGLHADARGVRYRWQDPSAVGIQHEELDELRQAVGMI